jgi:asparagine synthase (glutamine-hydrolysing)
MTNFLMVADPDPGRRALFCRTAKPRLALLEGLVLDECGVGDFTAMWASGPRAPVSRWSDGASAAIVWGRALADDDGRLVQAAELPAMWTDVARAVPPAFDGYYVAVSYDPHRGMTVGADILGMYPVFWWSDGTVHLVGSSPELFKHHPRFRWNLDLAGMAGILLTTHSVGGRTLMDSVRRLGPGHLLVAAPTSLPREVRQYELPVSTDYFDLPYSGAVELLHDTLHAAVARHVPAGVESTLALSGGRDSRLLAGLMEQTGRPFDALTLGNEDDFEMRCATSVARALSVDHHKAPVPLEDKNVDLHVKWLHCSSGFSAVSYWHCDEILRPLSAFLVNGYAMDATVGGSQITWAYDHETKDLSFPTFLARANTHAVSAIQLRQLLKHDIWRGIQDEVVEHLRNTYKSYSPYESQRASCFALHHRQRFHMGNPPWLLSFGSWPILPAVDKRLLKVAGGLPAAAFAERRAQDDIIRAKFPILAELPLDRNSPDTSPLNPRIRHLLMRAVMSRVEPLKRRLPQRERERRYYVRLYDFNGPMWKAARQRAEPYRKKLWTLFDKDALDDALPPPNADVRTKNSIVDTHGMKILVGLCLWSAENL